MLDSITSGTVGIWIFPQLVELNSGASINEIVESIFGTQDGQVTRAFLDFANQAPGRYDWANLAVLAAAGPMLDPKHLASAINQIPITGMNTRVRIPNVDSLREKFGVLLSRYESATRARLIVSLTNNSVDQLLTYAPRGFFTPRATALLRARLMKQARGSDWVASLEVFQDKLATPEIISVALGSIERFRTTALKRGDENWINFVKGPLVNLAIEREDLDASTLRRIATFGVTVFGSPKAPIDLFVTRFQEEKAKGSRVTPHALDCFRSDIPSEILNFHLANLDGPDAACILSIDGLSQDVYQSVLPQAKQEHRWDPGTAIPKQFSQGLDRLLELAGLSPEIYWIASHPRTRPETLRQLSLAGIRELNRILAANERLPQDVFIRFAGSDDLELLWIVATNPGAGPEALDRIVDRGISQLGNTALPPILFAALEHWNISSVTLEKVFAHREFWGDVAPSLNATAQMLDTIAVHGTWYLRTLVAKNTSASGETLHNLSLDPNPTVRAGVARNWHTWRNTQEVLLTDQDSTVVDAAQDGLAGWASIDQIVELFDSVSNDWLISDPETIKRIVSSIREDTDSEINWYVLRDFLLDDDIVVPEDVWALFLATSDPHEQFYVATLPNAPWDLTGFPHLSEKMVDESIDAVGRGIPFSADRNLYAWQQLPNLDDVAYDTNLAVMIVDGRPICGLTAVVPKTPRELKDISARMRNCLSEFSEDVREGECVVTYFKDQARNELYAVAWIFRNREDRPPSLEVVEINSRLNNKQLPDGFREAIDALTRSFNAGELTPAIPPYAPTRARSNSPYFAI